MEKLVYKKYLKQMAAYCSRSEKCEFDIRQKLEKTELSIDKQDELIKHLKDSKYIDNERYAVFFTNDKFKFNKWGKQKIRTHLMQKQIDSELINKALDSIDTIEYKKVLSEIIEKKIKSTKESNKYKLKEKIVRNALSKGFEMDLIFKQLSKKNLDAN